MCIFHDMLSVKGVTIEDGLAIVALAGHETRPAFLDWFGANPNSAKTPPIEFLDRVAAVRQPLLAELLKFPADEGNGPKALAHLRARLGSNCVAGASPAPPVRKSCCGG